MVDTVGTFQCRPDLAYYAYSQVADFPNPSMTPAASLQVLQRTSGLSLGPVPAQCSLTLHLSVLPTYLSKPNTKALNFRTLSESSSSLLTFSTRSLNGWGHMPETQIERHWHSGR